MNFCNRLYQLTHIVLKKIVYPKHQPLVANFVAQQCMWDNPGWLFQVVVTAAGLWSAMRCEGTVFWEPAGCWRVEDYFCFSLPWWSFILDRWGTEVLEAKPFQRPEARLRVWKAGAGLQGNWFDVTGSCWLMQVTASPDLRCGKKPALCVKGRNGKVARQWAEAQGGH